MSFNFDAIKKKLIANRTMFNVDGIYQAGAILECLEICPFIDVVAEFLNMPVKTLYGKLKYYLTGKEFNLLLETILARRKFELFSFKNQWKRKLASNIKI